MRMSQALASPGSPSAGAGLAALAAAVVLGVAFFLTEHNVLTSKLEAYGTTAEELEAQAAGGKWTNQVGFSLVGLLGLGLLASRGGRPVSLTGALPWLVLAAVAWCLASALWSVDPPRTAKRGAILLLCLLGALGVARRLSPRDLCLLAVVTTAAYAAVGLAAELALGTFLTAPDEYRFAGSLHPNGQGTNAALLCLAAFCLLSGTDAGKGGKGLLVALLVFGAGLLLLSKSRTALAALTLSVLALRGLRPSGRFVAAGLSLLWLAGALALTGLLAGLDVGEEALALLSLGRAEHVGTLTGRTELWPELLPYIQKRPLLGYGYGAFWDEAHIEDVSSTVYWGLSSAHSVYVDAVLGLGLVGGAALALAALAGLARSAIRYRAAGGAGQAFAFALLLYGLIDGVAESDFIAPSFATFLAGCGLCRLAFFRGDEVPAGDAAAELSPATQEAHLCTPT
jgi:O-antigen ligase